MSAPLASGVVYPPVRVEFDPPESVDWSSVEDENLRELLQEEMRLRNYWLQSLWEEISGGLNWGGALRLEDGRPYRYDSDAEEWLSFARPVFFFGSATPGTGYLDIVGGITCTATVGYYLPQDCTLVRWWARWTTAANIGDTIRLKVDDSPVQTWAATAGTEVSFSEDAFDDADAGSFVSADVSVNVAGITDLSVGVEVAWRTTFSA